MAERGVPVATNAPLLKSLKEAIEKRAGG